MTQLSNGLTQRSDIVRHTCWTTLSLALAVGAIGCGGADAANPAPPGMQYIVGIDISGSRTPTQLEEAQNLLGGVIGRMEHGDRIVVLETYRARSDSAVHWEDSLPARKNPEKLTGQEKIALVDFRELAIDMTGTFFDPARYPKMMSTDLFSTLARAADYTRSARGRRTVVLLLSDMLQSTPDVNMERTGGIPGVAWIEERRVQGRLPDLSGVCVVVAGADVVSARGAQVRDFWERYFAATGATFSRVKYRNMIADPTEVGCA